MIPSSCYPGEVLHHSICEFRISYFVYRISYIVFQHVLGQESCPGQRCVAILYKAVVMGRVLDSLKRELCRSQDRVARSGSQDLQARM